MKFDMLPIIRMSLTPDYLELLVLSNQSPRRAKGAEILSFRVALYCINFEHFSQSQTATDYENHYHGL